MHDEAVKAITKLAQEATLVNGPDGMYSVYPLIPVFSDPRPEKLVIHSLTGIVDYVMQNIDNLSFADIMLHIVDHAQVNLITNVHGESNQRHVVLSAEYDGGENFIFGQWYDQEEFIIKVQSGFAHTEDMDYVLHYTSKIDSESAIVTQDDGVTQRIQVKKGVSGALVEAKSVQPIVSMRPYRTFSEIEQPESTFLFRIKSDTSGVKCALFFADNSEWKNVVRLRISELLKATGIARIA